MAWGCSDHRMWTVTDVIACGNERENSTIEKQWIMILNPFEQQRLCNGTETDKVHYCPWLGSGCQQLRQSLEWALTTGPGSERTRPGHHRKNTINTLIRCLPSPTPAQTNFSKALFKSLKIKIPNIPAVCWRLLINQCQRPPKGVIMSCNVHEE